MVEDATQEALMTAFEGEQNFDPNIGNLGRWRLQKARWLLSSAVTSVNARRLVFGAAAEIALANERCPAPLPSENDCTQSKVLSLLRQVNREPGGKSDSRGYIGMMAIGRAVWIDWLKPRHIAAQLLSHVEAVTWLSCRIRTKIRALGYGAVVEAME